MKFRSIIIFSAIIVIALIVTLGWQPIKAATSRVVNLLRNYSRLNDGLVGYWSFDGADVSGTTATDLGSGGNNGTLTGGVPSASGIVGQALNFDGSNDYVSVADPANGALDFGTGDFTISAWIKTSSSAQMRIVNKRDASNIGYEIYLASGSNVIGALIGDAGGIVFGNIGTANLRDDNWHHVVVVYNRSGNAVPYVDGAQDGSGTSIAARSGSIDNAQNFAIGRYDQATTNYFNGLIDEPRVYNRALSTIEITELFKHGDPVQRSRSFVGNSTGLVSFWNFDDCDTCTSAIDKSGGGNTATLYNAAGPTAGDLHTTAGKIGNALSFDGTNDYTSAPDSASYAFANNIVTLEAWIKAATAGNGTQRAIISQYNGGVEGGVLFFLQTNNTLRYHDGGSGNVTTNATFTDGNWHHVVYVSQSSTSHQIYIDGVLDIDSSTVAVVANSTQNMQIGALLSSGVPGSYFNGKIDEVKIYNRALTATEVLADYRSSSRRFTNMPQTNLVTDGLVGFWNFNGPDVSGTTVNDKSGQGNNGTLTSGAGVGPGLIGQGLTLDGVNDYVSVGDPASGVLDFGTGNFTLSAWVRPSALHSSGNSIIMGKRQSGSPFTGFTMYFNSAQMVLQLNDTAQNAFNLGNFTAGNMGRWSHVAVVVDRTGTNKAFFYLNGSLVGSGVSIAAATGSISGTGGFSIGRDADGTSLFIGTEDEARIYNRALTAAEVSELYKTGKRD